MKFWRFSIAWYMKVLTQLSMKDSLWTDDLDSAVPIFWRMCLLKIAWW